MTMTAKAGVLLTHLARRGHIKHMAVSGCSIRRGAIAACALALSTAACGRVGSDGSQWSPHGGNGGNIGAAGNAGSGGSAASGGALGGANSGGNAGAAIALIGTPRPSEARRLTAAEYQFTVTDQLGTSTQVDLSATLSLQDGFDNIAANNGIDDTRFYRYLDTAEKLGTEVFSSATLRARIVTCTQTDDMTCVAQIIEQTGLHLFRRPLLDEEVMSYQKVYTRARARMLDHNAALNDVLVALLVSAEFLYRMEFVPAAAGNQPLSSYDIASRLSYLLWSSAPDDELLTAAQQDKLQAADALAAEVARLLQDPKAVRFAHSFLGQWFETRRLPGWSFDPTAFNQWNQGVASAAADEMLAYFAELLQQDKPWPTLLDSRAHFVTPDLAKLYGLTVMGPVTQRVELPGVDRQGLLGLVGVLAQTSQRTRSEPSLRGSWILEHLLCSPLPPEPPDMPAYTSAQGEPNIRSYLLGLNAQPGCTSCHAQIDPLGLALENYDALGRYRTTYSNTFPIDASAALSPLLQTTGDLNVSGIAAVSGALQTSPLLSACAAQKLYVYGMGRAFTEAERANVQTLTQQWQSGTLTLRQLILSFVASAEFRSRSDGGDL